MNFKERIEEKIAKSMEAIEEVEENLPENFDEFRKLGLIKDGIYKKIEFVIQNIIDICAILVKELKLGVPENEEEILFKLEDIFNKKTINKIIELKGFRNILVHRYGQIDDKIAFEDIIEGLEDFENIFEKIETVIREI
ncbi:MAG TPA: DUF86 domain-containing protein [Candidatus Aenigmarchaeota archaeon]|nr:DUF86 domain-containing protein [Candidatus Aenigmarchaeota archaeon]